MNYTQTFQLLPDGSGSYFVFNDIFKLVYASWLGGYGRWMVGYIGVERLGDDFVFCKHYTDFLEEGRCSDDLTLHQGYERWFPYNSSSLASTFKVRFAHSFSGIRHWTTEFHQIIEIILFHYAACENISITYSQIRRLPNKNLNCVAEIQDAIRSCLSNPEGASLRLSLTR